MTQDFLHGNRVVQGGCVWEQTPDARGELDRLAKADSFAYGNLLGQIQESEGGGLGRSRYYREPRDFRCPLKFTPNGVVDPPWLGELKASGKAKRGLEWRLYFGEPTNVECHVVGIHLRDSKRGTLTEFQNARRQKQHVSAAMKYLKSFFRDKGYRWAPFPD